VILPKDVFAVFSARGAAMTKPLSGAQMIALRNCARQDGYCRAYVSQYSLSIFESLLKRGLIELRGVVYVTTEKGEAHLARRAKTESAADVVIGPEESELRPTQHRDQ
jgi:hypothetical protein